jgi:hypothetical protein
MEVIYEVKEEEIAEIGPISRSASEAETGLRSNTWCGDDEVWDAGACIEGGGTRNVG